MHLPVMRGYTLIELLLVLSLAGMTAASAAPAARRYRDRGSVVAAREAVVGLLAEARLAAVERGAATLRLEASPPRATVIAGADTLGAADLAGDFDVRLRLGGGATAADLAYDALGLGRLAGRTVVFERGGASATLVVSGYGRVRRR